MGKMSRQKKQRRRKRAVSGQNRFAMLSITFVVCMLFGVLLYNSHKMEQRIRENQDRLDLLDAQIEDEKVRTQDIYDLEEEMQTDEYIAGVAQKKLGLVKEDQIIFKPQK